MWNVNEIINKWKDVENNWRVVYNIKGIYDRKKNVKNNGKKEK